MSEQSKDPTTVWMNMLAGNTRFVEGNPRHPRQDIDRRTETAGSQNPHAALFGCSDSRLAAEIIFDEGLADLFVVRNAGQVSSESVIGSLEFAVAILKVPLIVVLGHDKCGAVSAAIDSTSPEAITLPSAIWRQISPIVPTVRNTAVAMGIPAQDVPADLVGSAHLEQTVQDILNRSECIDSAVRSGNLAIVAANYKLDEGRVTPVFSVGLRTDSSTT